MNLNFSQPAQQVNTALALNKPGTGVGIVSKNAANSPKTINPAVKAAQQGTLALANTPFVLDKYEGRQKNFGSISYDGMQGKQVDYTITDTNGAANDKWFLFDYNGLSGKTTAQSITIGVTSNLVLTAANGYTALKSFYATSGVVPTFNSVRIQGDAANEIGLPMNFAYFDDISQTIQTIQVTPSLAFNQDAYQNAQGEFGFSAAILPNFVVYGTVNPGGIASAYIYLSLYMQNYIGDRKIIGQGA